MTEKGYVRYCKRCVLVLIFTFSRYSLRDGASFAEQAQGASFELVGDDGVADRKRRNLQMKWDRKKKKFVKGDGVGADNVKLVKTESGARLPATYRSGRFDEWKAKNRTFLPKVGEAEAEGSRGRLGGSGGGGAGRRFKHQGTTTAKPLDKLRTDYERKVRQTKKGESGGAQELPSPSKGGSRPGPAGKKSRYNGKSMARVKSELKSAHQIRKTREFADRKRAKNARPSRKGKR